MATRLSLVIGGAAGEDAPNHKLAWFEAPVLILEIDETLNISRVVHDRILPRIYFIDGKHGDTPFFKFLKSIKKLEFF